MVVVFPRRNLEQMRNFYLGWEIVADTVCEIGGKM